MALARASRVHHSTLQALVAGRSRPGLDTVIQLAWASGVSVARLVGERISTAELKKTVIAKPALARSRGCKKYAWEQIRKLLQTATNDSTYPSLHLLCQRAGIDQGYVSSRFPRITRLLVDRMRTSRAAGKRKRETQEELEVEAAVRLCVQYGKFPSDRRLRPLLRVPGCLRRRGMRELRERVLSLVRSEKPKISSRKESMAGSFAQN
jgi:hypothetical protein